MRKNKIYASHKFPRKKNNSDSNNNITGLVTNNLITI